MIGSPTRWNLRENTRLIPAALLLLLTLASSQTSWASAAGLTPGALSLSVQGVQHTLDAFRYGDIRPTPHTDFGGRLGLAYAFSPCLELAISGYHGASHFNFDTGFEKGLYRDWDWSMDVGPNFLLGQAGSARFLLGGALVYGEARSRLTLNNVFGGGTLEGPRTFMVGGAGRLVAIRPLLWRLEAAMQLSVGVMQARGHASPSGNLYEWNGGSFAAALGVRAVLVRGRHLSE